jgi:hypothetical protein
MVKQNSRTSAERTRSYLVPASFLLSVVILVLNLRDLDDCTIQSLNVMSSLSSASVPMGGGGGDAAASLQQSNPERLCNSFFTVMSGAFLPKEQTDGHRCEYFYRPDSRWGEVLNRQSQAMLRMNSTLTIFTSWTEQQIQNCQGRRYLPGIEERQFDPVDLLTKYGFTEEQIGWLQHWHEGQGKLTFRWASTRLSDVWRILLAREHQMAYVDLDMFHVHPSADIFLGQPNVAVPIWEYGGTAALEIQNSGFCFTAAQLDILIHRLKVIVQSKGKEQVYSHYTELGEY